MYNKPRVSSRKPKFRVKKAGKTKRRKAKQRQRARRANNERDRALQRQAELRRSRNRQQLRGRMAAAAARVAPVVRRRLTLAGDVNQDIYLPEHLRRQMARMVQQPRGFAGRDLSQLFADPRERREYLTGRRRSANRVKRFMGGMGIGHLNIPEPSEDDLGNLYDSCQNTMTAREQRLVARHAVRAYVAEYSNDLLYGIWYEAQNEGDVAEAYTDLQAAPTSYRRKLALKDAIMQTGEGQLYPGTDRNVRARLLQISGWNLGDFGDSIGLFEGKVCYLRYPLPFTVANKAFYFFSNGNLTDLPKLLQMMPGIPTDANGDIDFLDDMFWPRTERQLKRSIAKLGCEALNTYGF